LSLRPRQTFTFVGKEAGPLEAAGKDVAGVVKSIDAKLAAVGIIGEIVKSQCKGCPSVSTCLLLHDTSSLTQTQLYGRPTTLIQTRITVLNSVWKDIPGLYGLHLNALSSTAAMRLTFVVL